MISPSEYRCLLVPLVIQAHPDDLDDILENALLLREIRADQARERFLTLVAQDRPSDAA